MQVVRPEAMKTQLGLKLIRRSHPSTSPSGATSHHYFIANLTPHDVDATVPLAVDFSRATWIDPMVSSAPYAAEVHDGQLRVRLRSGESRLLWTENSTATGTPGSTSVDDSHAAVAGAEPDTLFLTRGWTLTFMDSTPAVAESFRLDALNTWEGLSQQTAELMGTGVYECTFDLDTDEQVQRSWQIDLGDVRESARVSLNDKEIGCAWAVPFVLPLPEGVLRKGQNHLRIEVTNLPANHIAALDRQQVPWRKFEDINVVDINYRRSTYENWSPMPSGLKGPVCIISR